MLHLDDAVCARNGDEEEILHFDVVCIRWAMERVLYGVMPGCLIETLEGGRLRSMGLNVEEVPDPTIGTYHSCRRIYFTTASPASTLTAQPPASPVAFSLACLRRLDRRRSRAIFGLSES